MTAATVTSSVSRLSPVLVELAVQVPWDLVRGELDKSYGKLQRTAQLRGFRKGKVPRQVLRQFFGAQVESEVTSTLIQAGLFEAVKEHQLTVVAAPTVEPERIVDGAPLAFKAKVEVRPQVEELKIDGLPVKTPTFPVDDAQVEAELERLRGEHADLVSPDPARPARAKDRLVIDYEVTIDGEKKPDLGATAKPVDLGDGSLLDALETGLTGVSEGEEKDIDVPFPADHPSERLRGKTARFHVTVKELRERRLPDLDDEFAKDVGDHESLDALRADIRRRLEMASASQERSALREALVDALCDTHPIPLPPSLVAQQEAAMTRAIQQSFRGRVPIDEETIRKGAERKVRAAILFGEVAMQHGLRVEQADIDARLQIMAAAKGKHVAKLRAEYADQEKRETLESDIMHEKIAELLESKASIERIAPAAPPAIGVPA